MKFLNEFAKMKSEFKAVEKANEIRKQEHNHRFEQLQKESEVQAKRVNQRFQFIRSK
ncbi:MULTISPECIES: hypothetical protein [Lactococcus]|uniref:hypothetical protein n=1 Tax=Lactococcus TaxID=1357 RepID=UPI001BCC6D64|nr:MULTISPECIES: hypothetical protein [Lactococcus]MBS4464269.1 hypothetical protein [Lactococcus garvieae]